MKPKTVLSHNARRFGQKSFLAEVRFEYGFEMKDDRQDGALSWQHFRDNYLERQNAATVVESPILGNVKLSGSLSIGTVDVKSKYEGAPQGFIRLSYPREPSTVGEHRISDNVDWTGGHPADEVAMLLSLISRAPFRAPADRVRTFTDEEPYGRESGAEPYEMVPKSKFFEGRPVLSGLRTNTFRLQELADPIQKYAQLEKSVATEFLRAASCYRDSIWIANRDPNYAWLMMVSAVEVAANRWWSGEIDSVELLRDSKPKLHAKINDIELLRLIGEEFGETLRPTKKFLEFLMTFGTQAPTRRPTPEWSQLDWASEKGMKKVFEQIYKHRSVALHGGKPFPAPMCEPPLLRRAAGDLQGPLTEEEVFSDKSTSHTAFGHAWSGDELPMRLSLFEGIVWRSLTAWLETGCSVRQVPDR
jgi:hypothetical protein